MTLPANQREWRTQGSRQRTILSSCRPSFAQYPTTVYVRRGRTKRNCAFSRSFSKPNLSLQRKPCKPPRRSLGRAKKKALTAAFILNQKVRRSKKKALAIAFIWNQEV